MLVVHGVWTEGGLAFWAESPTPTDAAAPHHPHAATPPTLTAALSALFTATLPPPRETTTDTPPDHLPQEASTPDRLRQEDATPGHLAQETATPSHLPQEDATPGDLPQRDATPGNLPQHLALADALVTELELLLPGSAREPLPSPETGRLAQTTRPRLRRWRVPAVVPSAGDTLRILAEPAGSATVRHWSAVAHFAADLVRRGRIVPQLIHTPPPADVVPQFLRTPPPPHQHRGAQHDHRSQPAADLGAFRAAVAEALEAAEAVEAIEGVKGIEAVEAVTASESMAMWAIPTDNAEARWRPVLTGSDAAHFRELAAAMPPACRTSSTELPSTQVLRAALDAFTDAWVRATVTSPAVTSPKTLEERWLAALTGDDPACVYVETLAAELTAWHDTVAAADGATRVCFRLLEPQDTDDWRVELALQPVEDPSLYVPAERVWSGEPVPGLPRRAERELLAGLGRAVRLYPGLDLALRVARPSELALDTAGAFTFLRQGAPLLQAAGFGVQLPRWARRTKLGLKLTTRTKAQTAATSQGFGLQQLVDFRLDLAVGDETISEAELAELARAKVPLVRVRGQWVELDERQLKAALRAVEGRRDGELTAGEILQHVIQGDESELPLLEIDADGPLGDLLSGQADRRLTPVPTPDGIDAQLRPYQERGLAWLSFLSTLGLGGVLADDMGLGKCVLPETPVFIDGRPIKAKDLWRRYAGGTRAWDGEGEWAEPAEPVFTNALDGFGRVVTAPVTRLYRQHVSERVRMVSLDDGSQIALTRRHRLLSLDGWTTQFRPGDRIAVPSTLEWTGEPVDPDLVTLLAWQISEGHELDDGRVTISQKREDVLVRVRECLMRFAARTHLDLNTPSIHRPPGKVPYLRFNSVAYARFLEERHYRFGSVSAHKRIPEFLVSADEESIRLFLREYFTAEGSVLPSGLIEISSASPWLMHQLSCMLRRLSIRMRTATKRKGATNGSGIKRDYQVGSIGGPGLRTFLDRVGFSDQEKQRKLQELCRKQVNTNTDGIPAHDLLSTAQSVTRLPLRHFGVGTVYFTGSQELSRSVAYRAVAAMDRILSGEALADYLLQPRTKWTDRVTHAYRHVDGEALSAARDTLLARAQQQVLYAKVVSVEEFDYEGYVYDLEVPEHHNFMAAGILCHNTIQTLSLLVHEKAVKPTLLVCPMSLVGNWQREAARFAPGLRVYVHHGSGRDPALIEGAELVITTYGTAQRDLEVLKGVAWHRVVCDEAQAIKNSGTLQARAVRALPAGSRLALTGTPVENHLAELWSIMEFCNPGLLGSRQRFRSRFQEPIEARQDEQAAQALRRATGPFVLRRLKTDKSIISDLPEKLEVKEWCTLTAEQASLYQAVVDDMMGRIDDSDGIERRGLVLAAMAKLKQVCNHPAHLLKDGSRLAGRSGKLARIEGLAEGIMAEGEKALFFTQYAEFGGMLQPYLSQRLDRPVLWLHGGLPKSARDRLVDRFQSDGEPAVFLLSLKAAGVGLNLTAANHVVHMDRWWNPAVEDQATDRAFRIGQKKNVQVRKLICAGTIEERVDEMIERKKALAERVVGSGEDWLTDLSTDELREVFKLGDQP